MSTINKALLRPILIAGVEKRLVLLNSLLCFPLVAATRFHFPSCLLGVVLFAVFHTLLTQVSKHDPYLGQLIQRASHYLMNPVFYAKSHPSQLSLRPIKVLP